MMQPALHPAPRDRDVVVEQIRVVALALRPVALVCAAVIGVLTVMITIDIVRGSAQTWFDSDDWSPILFFTFALPFGVWRADKRFGPAFLWTLPVDRRRLAIAKVFAGWFWMIAVLAIFIVWQRVFAHLSDLTGTQTFSPFAFAGATAAYLLGSAVVLALRHPLRWLFGGIAVIWLADFAGRVIGHSNEVEIPFERMDAFWRTLPHSSQNAIATVVSISIGLAALAAALARHRERHH